MNTAIFLNNLGAKLLIRHGCNMKESQDLFKGSLSILQLAGHGSVGDVSCHDSVYSQNPHVKKALELAKTEQVHLLTTFATKDFDDKSYFFVYLQPIVIDLTSIKDPCCPLILAAIVSYNMALYENLAYLQGPGEISYLKKAIALYEMALNILPNDEHVSIAEHVRAALLNNIGAMKYEQRDYNGAALRFAHLKCHVAEMNENIHANVPGIILNLVLLSSLQPAFVAVAA